MLLFERAQRELDEIAGLTDETWTRRTREELRELVAGLQAHTGEVLGLLEQPASEMKHALFVALNTNYENHVHRTWYLQREYADGYTDRVTGQLERLAEILEHIVVANRLFEATFIEEEIAELSRYLLYVGLPVQVLAVGVTLVYTAPGAVPLLPETAMAVLVPATIVAGFTPFLILSAYIVRLTVVARRTADTFPFSSQLKQPMGLRDGFRTDAE